MNSDSVLPMTPRVAESGVRVPLRVSERRLLLLGGDFGVAILAGVLAVTIWFAWRPDIRWSWSLLTNYSVWIGSLAILWVVITALCGAYDLRTSARFLTIARRIAIAAAISAILILVFYFLTASSDRSVFTPLGEISVLRAVPVLFVVMATTLTLGWRGAYARLMTNKSFAWRILIVGAGYAARTFVDTFESEHADALYRIIGLVDDDSSKLNELVGSYKVLGAGADLPRLVSENRVDELVLAISGPLNAELFDAVMSCFERGIQVTPMPVLYESLTGRVPVEHVGAMWYVSLPVGARPPGRAYKSLRRVADFAFGLVGLFVVACAIPFVWIGNQFGSRGPLFFYQRRVGRAGQYFEIVKFRTMVIDAEKATGAVWATERDPRITPFGNFMRKTRIDELPQFLNVLKGEMSIIGPRPERPEFVSMLTEQLPFYASRHAVRPGLTGWAQVRYRYGASVTDALMKLQYDLYYIKHQGIWIDLLILLKTIGVVAGMKGR